MTAANKQLGSQLQDVRNVTIGFGKEVANTVVNVFELVVWLDVTVFMIRGAHDNAHQQTMVQSGAEAVVRRCVGNKLKQLARPAVFNITGIESPSLLPIA